MRNLMNKCATVGRAIFNPLRGLSLALCLLVLAGLGNVMQAVESVTIPSTGVDFPGYIAAAATALGLVIAAVVGVYFAFQIIKAGMAWSRRAIK